MTNLDALVASLRATTDAKRDLKNDEDIIEWVRANWRLFTKSRKDMYAAIDQMRNGAFTYDIDGLVMTLELPDGLFLRRLKSDEARKAVLKWDGSKAATIYDAIEKDFPCPTVLFVAGLSSIVVTRAGIKYPQGMQLSLIPGGDDARNLYIYPYDQATERQPNIFRGKYER
jgi:hypothetical protein